MNWNKPHYEERRFGFEVTMYIYQKPNLSTTLSKSVYVKKAQRPLLFLPKAITANRSSLLGLALCALLSIDALADDIATLGGGICDDGGSISGVSWPLHGLNRFNSSNASSISQLNKTNVNNFQLKWIYTIPTIPSNTPLNPIDNPRAENGVSNGVAIDKNGIIYAPTFDGHMYIIDSLHTSGTDPVTGFAAPVVLNSLDFFSDPAYAPAGFDGFSSRMHPSLINGAIYAGNYQYFGAKQTPPLTGFANKNVGTSNPTDPNYKGKGATLYKIDATTGNLLWKTVIDSNQQTMISSVGAISVPWIFGQNLIIVGFASELSGTLGLYAPEIFGAGCCNYRGGLAAVLESTGQLIWKTYTSPKQRFDSLATIIQRGTVDAWTGGSIWGGGNFPVSYKNAMVYAGTGEVYNAPDAADACEQARLANPDAPILDTQCLKVLQNGTVSNASFGDSILEKLIPLVWSPKLPQTSSIVAYNYYTGHIEWAQPMAGFDTWNLSCLNGVNKTPFCPPYLRGDTSFPLQLNFKDRDITQPILIENIKVKGKKRDIVLAMGKGATVFAFDAATGESLWQSTAFGLGGLVGDGFVWGKAADGMRFYGNTGTSSSLTLAQYQDPSNPAKVVPHSCDLTGGPGAGFGSGNGDPNGQWAGGMYVAINLTDGSLAWQRCVVGKVINTTTRLLLAPAVTQPGRSQAPMTVANNVVIAPGASSYIPFDTARENTAVYAEVLLLDADNGALLNSLPLSVSYNAPSAKTITYQRPQVVGDRLYIANGGHAVNNSTDIASPFNRLLMYQLSH